MKQREFDSAVIALLRQPALKFSRELRRELDKDVDYARKHKPALIPKLDFYMSHAGVYWKTEDIDENMDKLVRELVVTLRSIEKG